MVSFVFFLCCSRSLDSFSFSFSCSNGNCVYFTSRSMTPWLLSYSEQQENQKGMNLEHRENRWEEIHWRRCSRGVYLSKAGAFIILPRPMSPVVSPRGWISIGATIQWSLLLHPVWAGSFCFSPVLLFKGSLFSSLACTSTPPLLSTVTWPFCCLLALLSEGGKQRKLKELNYEPAFVVTATQIW